MASISVGKDVLAAQPGAVASSGRVQGWSRAVSFIVVPREVSEQAAQRLSLALREAARRFLLVDENGIESPGPWVFREGRFPDGLVLPARNGNTWMVGAFRDDVIVPPQAATILRVLLGELHCHEVDAQVSCAYESLRADEAWEVLDESGLQWTRPPVTGNEKWLISRLVHRRTTTGYAYAETEWRTPDGQWTRNPREGLTFDGDTDGRARMMEVVLPLRAESADRAKYGPVTGHKFDPNLPLDEAGLPPAEIRDHGHVWDDPTLPA